LARHEDSRHRRSGFRPANSILLIERSIGIDSGTFDMTRQYFGTDGIRGTVGQPPITPDFVLRLAHAVGRVLRESEDRPRVMIGKDTRISGYMLESALESGFNSAGVDVVLLGPLPTPGVAYLTRALRVSLGVVISASHNPFDDNGIKFFSAQGTKLSDAWEEAVEAKLAEPPDWATSHVVGKTRRLEDAAGRYIEFCKSTFANELTLRGLKIVVDAAHGAAYHIAPKVFHELGAEVIEIGCAPDGFNINEGVGATHPDALVREVITHHADFGIALDGDADRLQMVDSTGRLFNGDELLYLMVSDRLSRGERVEGAVGTLMTNMAVEVALEQRGVTFVRAAVGDRYVLAELDRRGWLLGGEGSGHLLALDRHTTGDGLISALQVLEATVRGRASIAELLAGVTLFPQVLQNVRMAAGTDWRANTRLAAGVRQVEEALGAAGRVLIRASGTEPVLRIMVEARDAALARGFAQQLVDLVPSVASGSVEARGLR
jgi:phosphoglucosamine mutase